MSNFTGQKIANTYKNLLQVNTSNSDLSSTLISVETGAGNTTPLQLATDKVNINGTFQLGGVTLTANVTALNNIADLSGITGIVVGDSGTLTGRTLVGASPISITNANGVAGNPTINLATTGITSATYGPLGRFNIDTYGRVIDVSIATTVSANSFIGGVFNGSSLTVENNTSIGGDVVIAGTTNMKAVSATDATLNNLTVGTKITAATVTATTVETSILRATKASITDLTADTISFENVSVSTIDATNIIAVSANATRLFKNGEDVATSATVATLSATMATSIDNANTNITTNTNAITSINSVIANLSSTLATSISERTQSITSINGVITDLSATLATSIGNRTIAITSINTVITNLSSTIATSINNSNINITANTNAITSINTVVSDLSATLATSIANHMPLSGGTFTGSVILNADPASNLQPATKQYVDNLTAAALHFHEAVRLESPINLTATYNNGTAGVGATLTNSGTQVALSIDGVATQVNDRILVYEQTDQTQNGVYVVTNIGSGSTNWILTRSSDTNTSGDSDANSLDEGSYFFVTEGDTGAGESYVCNTQGVITFGTTNITFIQFSSALNYTAGTGININNSRVISVSGVPSSATIATLSATMATSINNTNTNVTTNINAITSINSVITNLSSTFATSINNSNSNITTNANAITTNANAITSINTVVADLSATMATSINNRTNAITSVNSYITALSATLATSIANAGGGTTINNNANNRIITGSDTADTLEAESTLTYDGTNLNFADNKKATFGASADLQIYHSGSHSYIEEVGTGSLLIRATDLYLQDSEGNYFIFCDDTGTGGTVTLYHNSSAKLATASNGIDVTGTVTADGVSLGDSQYAYFGASNDMQIGHDTTNSLVVDNGTGVLKLRSNGTGVEIDTTTGESMATFNTNGSVNLYYDNSLKFQTVSDGIYVTGNVQSSTGEFEGASNQDRITIGGSDISFIINNSEEFRMQSDGDFHADGDVIAFSSTISDERLKTDIEKIENATDKVSQLNGYTFTYKADGKKSAGVIAQEVEKVLPSAVSEKELPLKMDDGVAYKTVQYDQIIGLLIESIKELKQEINELKGA